MVVVSAPQRLSTFRRFLNPRNVTSPLVRKQQFSRRALQYTELAEPRQPVAPWSVDHLATSWTAPSVAASEHPAVQRVLATFPHPPSKEEQQKAVNTSEVTKVASVAEDTTEQLKGSTKNRNRNKRDGQQKGTKETSREQEKRRREKVEETEQQTSSINSSDSDASSESSSDDDDDGISEKIGKPMSIVDAVGEISGEDTEKDEPLQAKNAAPWWSSRQRQKT